MLNRLYNESESKCTDCLLYTGIYCLLFSRIHITMLRSETFVMKYDMLLYEVSFKLVFLHVTIY